MQFELKAPFGAHAEVIIYSATQIFQLLGQLLASVKSNQTNWMAAAFDTYHRWEFFFDSAHNRVITAKYSITCVPTESNPILCRYILILKNLANKVENGFHISITTLNVYLGGLIVLQTVYCRKNCNSKLFFHSHISCSTDNERKDVTLSWLH